MVQCKRIFTRRSITYLKLLLKVIEISMAGVSGRLVTGSRGVYGLTVVVLDVDDDDDVDVSVSSDSWDSSDGTVASDPSDDSGSSDDVNKVVVSLKENATSVVKYDVATLTSVWRLMMSLINLIGHLIFIKQPEHFPKMCGTPDSIN